jgi:leucyl/phenylalanyl-tRNA--protein transferase
MAIRLLSGTGPQSFPSPDGATADGLLAVGGDLGVHRLLDAYRHGIFPWFGPGEPILWWSPDPRVLIYPDNLHVPRRLARRLRRGDLSFTTDRAFERVITACASIPRKGHPGTWLVPAMIRAYIRLHQAGYAHSVEVWREGALVGGLYGVCLGECFFGESMFSRLADTSKGALVFLVQQLGRLGYRWIDCQLPSDHLAQFGARPVVRKRFLAELAEGLRRPTRRGIWDLRSAAAEQTAAASRQQGGLWP